jgi:hypothetical protein
MSEVRSMPCSSCPYRKDVPSGVWAHHEYEKLRDYDAPTAEQPPAVFACHANRGNEYDLLALRLWPPPGGVPEAGVALFSSGSAAANWGQADIEQPSDEARATTGRLLRKYDRLRTEDERNPDAQDQA